MKTYKVSCFVESEDIEKNIKEMLTADMKNEARSIAYKAFKDALDDKISNIIVAANRDVEENWRGCELRGLVRTSIFEAIKELAKNPESNVVFEKAIEEAERSLYRSFTKLERTLREEIEKYKKELEGEMEKLMEEKVKKTFNDASTILSILEAVKGSK